MAKAQQVEKLPRGMFRRGQMIWIRYADADGKLRREPGGTTIKQAERKLEFRRGEKATGVIPVTRTDRIKREKERALNTFSAWIDAAQDHHDQHSSPKHAYDFKLRCVYVRRGLGNLPISEVKRGTILDWMEEAAEGGVTGAEEWGAATWNRYHSCLSSIFSLAIERAISDDVDPLPVNPMRWIKRRKENHKERYWSVDEDASIIASTRKLCPGTGYEDIFILAEEVGYRKSEQLRAVVGDYNPHTHKIAVHQRKNKSAGNFRYVPLSDRGVEAYERLAQGKRDGAALITKRVKGENIPMSKTRWFDAVLVDAGITDDAASWHVCRHTFCSRAVAAGVPITDLQQYAGHSHIATTARYTHGVEGVSDVRNREALNRKPAKQKSEVAALQEQIEALTALVRQLQTGKSD